MLMRATHAAAHDVEKIDLKLQMNHVATQLSKSLQDAARNRARCMKSDVTVTVTATSKAHDTLLSVAIPCSLVHYHCHFIYNCSYVPSQRTCLVLQSTSSHATPPHFERL